MAAALSFAASCVAPDDVTDEAVVAGYLPVGGGSGPIAPPPGDLAATSVTDMQIQLSWRCGSNQASSTRVMRSVGRDGVPEQIWELPVCPQGQMRSAVTGVQPATEYCFTVTASNDEYAEASEQLCVTSALDLDPPALPLVGISERTPTRLTWVITDQAINESYIMLEHRKLGTSEWRTSRFDRAERAHRATGLVGTVHSEQLEPGTIYEYRTRIGHDFAPVSRESPIFTTRTGWPVPAVPVPELVGDITNDAVTVTWHDVLFEAEYTVRVVKQSTGAVVKTAKAGPDVTRTRITGLEAATDYALDVEASNVAGESGRSSPIRVRTAAHPIAPSEP